MQISYLEVKQTIFFFWNFCPINKMTDSNYFHLITKVFIKFFLAVLSKKMFIKKKEITNLFP